MKYDVNYFIEKFEAIPDENFCKSMTDLNKENCHCYVGHCSGVDGESEALGCDLLWDKLGFSAGKLVTGGVDKYKHLNYKQRILAALYDIKRIQEGQEGKINEPKEKVKHVYHAVEVPSSITEQTKELIMQ